MLTQGFKWIPAKPIPSKVNQILEAYPQIQREILFQREITSEQDAIDFLLPKEKKWYSSIDLLHTEKSCQLIAEAIESNEKIAIYGDYDADGITSTALLYLALNKVTENLLPYIPNRFTEGYGLNRSAIENLHQQNTKLIITVDNGIRSTEEIVYANSLGMTVIITDHHTPDTNYPPAAAIMNPKSHDDPYPFKHLAGVGVVFKLVQSLSKHFPQIIPDDYLDLVAIGTVADVVPLFGENRYLVRRGLASINQFKRQGIVSLLGASNLISKKIRSTDISFQIGPRLNAAGRLGSAEVSLNLLISSNSKECGNLAQKLENNNFKRKKLSHVMEQRAEEIIQADESYPAILFAFDQEFHSGVSGIVAGSLTRKYYLPVIIGQIGDVHSVASCRSIPEFDIIQALDQCKDLFIRYGGHSQAAGFTIDNNKLKDFKEKLAELASSKLSGIDLKPSINIDAEVALSQLDTTLHKFLEKLEPAGAKNREVVFLSRDLHSSSLKLVGQDNAHLKMTISDGNYSFDSIGFGFGSKIDTLPPKFDALFNFQLNEFRGKKSFQLNLLDIRPC